MTQRPDFTTARWRIACAWIAIALNTAAASLWAFCGAIENFHEGWLSASLAANLLLSLNFLAPMLIFVVLGVLAVRWPIAGGLVYVLVGLLLGGWFLMGRQAPGTGGFLLALVMGGSAGGLGVLFMIGRARARKSALIITVGLPLLTAIISGAEPAFRAATRHDDGDRGERLVQGNGVALVWAPAGPGWPRDGVDWHEATRRCRHLAADGLSLADELLDLWRLPTVDEVVCSLTRGGENAGGTWDPATKRAHYERRPDKESPLWDPHSPIIYWWAADEISADRAHRVVYNGLVVELPKSNRMGSQAFRAVRRAEATAPPAPTR